MEEAETSEDESEDEEMDEEMMEESDNDEVMMDTEAPIGASKGAAGGPKLVGFPWWRGVDALWSGVLTVV